MTILVCDDDKEIVDAIEIYLIQEGYQVVKAYDGEQALDMLRTKKIDLMVIDVMMPKLDGIRATFQARKTSSIPIIILSAKTEDADKILGLNVGADDYVTKPFNPLELVARVKSQLRRYTTLSSTPSGDAVYEAGGLVINDELKKVRNTANRKIKDMDGVNIKPIQFNRTVEVGADIDFSGALEELDIDFDDVLSWTAKTATTAATGAFVGSFIPGVGTLIGAGVGAVVGGIAHACSGDGGKADARKSVSDAISKATQRAKSNVNSILAPVIRDVETQKRQLSNSVRTELANIEELQETLDAFDVEMSEFIGELKHKRYGRI